MRKRKDYSTNSYFASQHISDPIIILENYWKGLGELEKAKEVYQRGMDEAKKAGDKHSYNELQGRSRIWKRPRIYHLRCMLNSKFKIQNQKPAV